MKSDESMHNLSKQQSRNSAERTLLAWIRTSLTLIGFGFGIPGILTILPTSPLKDISTTTLHIKILGSSFIILGLLSIIIALFQYRRQIIKIQHPTFVYEDTFNLAFFVAITLFAIGLFAFISLL